MHVLGLQRWWPRRRMGGGDAGQQPPPVSEFHRSSGVCRKGIRPGHGGRAHWHGMNGMCGRNGRHRWAMEARTRSAGEQPAWVDEG